MTTTFVPPWTARRSEFFFSVDFGGRGFRESFLLGVVFLHPLHALHDDVPRLLDPPELHELTREERVVLRLLRLQDNGLFQELDRLFRLLEVRAALPVPVRGLAKVRRESL